MSGYIEIGSCVIARPPASMMMIAMTQAKIGRSMKKRAMRVAGLLRAAPAAGCASGGAAPASAAVDGRSRLDLLQAFHDDLVAGRETVLDQPFVADRPRSPSPGAPRPCRPAPTTIALVLPFGSRAMPCCGTRIAFSRTPLPTSARTYMPGSSMFCGFGTTTRSATLPVPGSTVTSENASLPSCGVRRAVLEQDLDGQVAGALDAAGRDAPAQFQELGARLREVDVDRIELLDRRERRGLVRGHERALRDRRLADPPGDGRGDARVAEDHAGALQCGLRGRDVRLGLLRARRRHSRPPACSRH